jgi:hypothetical protein
MDFEIQFDTRQFEVALEGFGRKALRPMARALNEEAEEIMGRSKEEFVPVDFGTLRSSGHVSPPEIGSDGVEVKMGFGGPAAPYAAMVHENPRAGKTGGRSPQGRKYQHWAKVGGFKYLEIPLNEARAGFSKRVGTRFWELLAGELG